MRHVPRWRPSLTAAVIGIGVAAAVAAVLLIRGADSSAPQADRSAPTRPPAEGPEVASVGRLRELADSVWYPVYWAGQRPGGYELTVDRNANIFIRYSGVSESVASRKATSLTIGTYPFANAFEILSAVSRGPGTTVGHTPDGGLVVVRRGSPRNAYIAYPQRDVQIEVYDPRAGRALELATAGAITPIL
jgi:hypothetical protein